MNENASYIFEVETPEKWVFDGSKTWVAGWFVSKTGAVFRDMRAWVDDRAFTGIFGLPRPEIEQKYRGQAGLPHAGFSFLIEPHRSAKLFRLELLDHGNNWVEIWRQPIKVTGGSAPARPALNPKLLPGVVSRLLKARRADATLHGPRAAPLAQTLVREAAMEQLVVQPSPPFWGALETPRLGGHSQYGKLPVTGWLIHLERRIVRLTASADPMMENAVELGRGRDDAVRMFPQHEAAATSGFFGMADIIEHRPDPAWLKVFAELDDGSRHLVFVRPFHQLNCNQKEQPYPEFRAAYFWDAVLTIWRACRAAHIRIGAWGELGPALREAYAHYEQHAPASLAHLALEQEPAYRQWVRHNRISSTLAGRLAGRAARLKDGPRLALLVDGRGGSAAHLEDLAASLTAQFYPNWEAHLVLPPDAPAAETARRLSRDPRFRVHPAAPRAPFADALNAALQATSAPYISLLPAHGRLSRDALLLVAESTQEAPNPPELIYTDEDRMDSAGVRSAPRFKPDWSPALALSGLFPGELAFLSRSRLLLNGGYTAQCDLAPSYAAMLRLAETLKPRQVVHLARICYHGRVERPDTIDLTDPSIEQCRQALQASLARQQLPAEALLPEIAHHRRRRFFQPRWSRDILARLPVTIVIPTRDRLHLLQECFELLNETVDWTHVRLIIVDDHSRDLDALHFLETIQRRTDLQCLVLRPANPRAPFNYSHLVNLALPHIRTPLVLHLNNDVNALEPGWLEEMAGWFSQADVGVVGAKLIYPDRSLNHTGIVVGPHGGLADTPLTRVQEADAPEIEWHAAAREVSAVTGACLLTRTDLYRSLGGFEETELGVAFNDVDYCLRARAAGYRVVYAPQAKLMHWGSATRGVTFDETEHVAFLRRHGGYRDPYLNPALQLEGARLVPSTTQFVHTDRRDRLHVLLLTHNLNLEGAPLFLVEYAEYLAQAAGFSLEVVTAQDGPLRARYEELSAKITLIDRHRIYAAADPMEFAARIEEVRAQVDFSRVDLVVCNTLVCFWGVHLAHAAGKPSLFYIHESTSIFRFFEKALPLAMHPLVGAAFRLATRALFLCRATENYFKEFDGHGNFRRVPSWIQVDAIERFRAAHSRSALRRKYGYAEDETIIANIGTVCERKGQHTFIRAVALLNRQIGAKLKLRFLLVGGRAGVYLDLLREEIARLGIANIDIVMETHDAYDFFQLADMFVCTSFEESFPRVLLEAMAFRTPIVSTDVHGIPEMAGQRQDAYLVPPGDEIALARMIKTCLDKERSGKTLTATAYSKVRRFYDYGRVLPHHVALAHEACLDFEPPPQEERPSAPLR